MRRCLEPGLKVAITLRYLATGDSYMSMAYGFCSVVPEVCQAIYDEFHEELIKCPSPDEWREVAKGFADRWNFNNCIGAIDGNHVKIQAPANSGSLYYNYKGTFSIVLMAVVDSQYKLLYIDVGANGSCYDGGVFKGTSLYKGLDQGKAGLPPPEPLPNSQVPVHYNLVADAAFAQKSWLVKPFSQRNLTKQMRIFNYRLSRARNPVENTFGILAQRFRCLLGTMLVRPDRAIKIVLACCRLHNLLIERKPQKVQRRVDFEDPDTHELVEGSWRQEDQVLLPLQNTGRNTTTKAGKDLKDFLMDYYNGSGSVEWQDRMVDPAYIVKKRKKWVQRPEQQPQPQPEPVPEDSSTEDSSTA
ncbi:protein ALP1-like [Gigantopelta aegis]|uniref:protein ALP1-like n=1 Tax=Gigantopelta aegis TaxID=1735272 RepID=UPI001B88A0CE|nr:protein ALP1-like [Gigantopelta aegis]